MLKRHLYTDLSTLSTENQGFKADFQAVDFIFPFVQFAQITFEICKTYDFILTFEL